MAVFLIIGPPQNGKSTLRRELVRLTNMQGGSCSDIIYDFLARRQGTTVAELRKLPKEELRPRLIEIGDYLCAARPDLTFAPVTDAQFAPRSPSALIRTLYLKGVRVIDGVRRREELKEAKLHFEWVGIPVHVIWVEKPDQPLIVDNTEPLKDLATFHMVNNKAIPDLHKQAHNMLKSLNWWSARNTKTT